MQLIAVHPLAENWRLPLREDREAIELTGELDFTEGFRCEHVTDRAETSARSKSATGPDIF